MQVILKAINRNLYDVYHNLSKFKIIEKTIKVCKIDSFDVYSFPPKGKLLGVL